MKRHLTNLIGIASLILAALLISVSGFSAAAAEPYDLHAILPLSGGAAFLGKADQQAIQLIENEVNKTGGIRGRPIRVIFHDDQTNPQVAVQIANEVIALHPAVILGSTIVATCGAMSPLVENGPVMFCFSPGLHPKPGSYVFAGDAATDSLSVAVIRYFRLKGWTKLAIITSTDATGLDAGRNLKQALALPENQNMTVVEQENFAPTDISVAAQIARIKEAKPQVLIAWSTGSPIATVLRELVQAGLDIPVLTTDGNMTLVQMEQYSSFLPKQLYVPASEWPGLGNPGIGLDARVIKKQKEFFDQFKNAGIGIDVGSSQSWDPTWIVIEALRKFGPNATAQQIHEYIGHLKNYAGVDGVYDFDKTPQRGLNADSAMITLWNPATKTWDPVSKPGGVPLR